MTANKINILKALGLLVRKHRGKVGISQEELAMRSSLDRTYISGIERGVRNPSLTALMSLSSGLGLNISELLENLEKDI